LATTIQSGASGAIKELTLRGIILGALITVILTAANVYAGLKIGLTVATSIPAAVISMAILKFFKDSTIQENNIVQTIASAAGTLSAIVFVLPGLGIISELLPVFARKPLYGYRAVAMSSIGFIRPYHPANVPTLKLGTLSARGIV